MEILAMFDNPWISLGLGAFSVITGGGLYVWIYRKIAVGKLLKGGMLNIAYKTGLFIYHNGVKQIKDKSLRDQFIKDLDLAGDEFNKGFDLGIRGQKLPK